MPTKNTAPSPDPRCSFGEAVKLRDGPACVGGVKVMALAAPVSGMFSTMRNGELNPKNAESVVNCSIQLSKREQFGPTKSTVSPSESCATCVAATFPPVGELA